MTDFEIAELTRKVYLVFNEKNAIEKRMVPKKEILDKVTAFVLRFVLKRLTKRRGSFFLC